MIAELTGDQFCRSDLGHKQTLAYKGLATDACFSGFRNTMIHTWARTQPID